MAITLLQTHVDVSLARQEMAAEMVDLKERLMTQIDALNHEMDDIRIGNIEVASMLHDLKNHLYYLQVGYVKVPTESKAMKMKVKNVKGLWFCFGTQYSKWVDFVFGDG
ncbi:unnamed protein product [Lactuca saligna]|uniref:Uncharacterized protein n=1 Tax=Lactuca saligna TaxID=75948 RepID=A0AA35Z533_LACSI|nr:unnamed protein product [Lactuca saligna]